MWCSILIPYSGKIWRALKLVILARAPYLLIILASFKFSNPRPRPPNVTSPLWCKPSLVADSVLVGCNFKLREYAATLKYVLKWLAHWPELRGLIYRSRNTPKMWIFGLLQLFRGNRSDDITSGSPEVTSGHMTSFPVMWLPPPASYSPVKAEMHQNTSFRPSPAL